MHVLPLWRDFEADHSKPVAAVFIAEIGTPFVPPTEIAAALFGLSRAEARVFHQIALGHSVPVTALELGAQPEQRSARTSRTYSKRPTHTARQI